MQDRFTKPLTRAAAVRLAERHVGAYNERDLDVMLLESLRVLGEPSTAS